MAKTREAETILIVEDEADIRNFASRVLELEGYRVLQAEDGGAALRLLRKCQISLLLLDLWLTGRDGWAVLAEIKADPELYTIPVIAFTASAAEAQKAKALSMGAANYLVKPLSVAGLRRAIAGTLHQSR